MALWNPEAIVRRSDVGCSPGGIVWAPTGVSGPPRPGAGCSDPGAESSDPPPDTGWSDDGVTLDLTVARPVVIRFHKRKGPSDD